MSSRGIQEVFGEHRSARPASSDRAHDRAGVPEARTYRLLGAPQSKANAAPPTSVFQCQKRSGATQRDHATEEGASSVPLVGHEPGVLGSSLGSLRVVATAPLVPQLGGG
ncbi:hypothetical protein NDU88_003441 [Pleurodeles waltl]|uniref:Uncharacterized protein n=1 Tax=Pleurodeles waltl TaxID=8319 RepID=A0AAV7LGZ6_PLEWA|nr:hypothetical protein NDU88_003441 [Pleurodeles waltl]